MGKSIGEKFKKFSADVGLCRLSIGPEGINAATEGTFVVVFVRDQSGECECRTVGGRMSLKSSRINLLGRKNVPQWRPCRADNSIVRYYPLRIKGPKSKFDRCDAIPVVINNPNITGDIFAKVYRYKLVDCPVTFFSKNPGFLSRRVFVFQLVPAFNQAFSIRRNWPSP